MRDGMNQRDGLSVQLGCGHPNTSIGDACGLCGEKVFDPSQCAICGQPPVALIDVPVCDYHCETRFAEERKRQRRGDEE